ncbi:MAG: glucosidase [Candidatus Rokubacteria bacterium]|nr:glucosidase [Candidatus Rokubacteria bacterium]
MTAEDRRLAEAAGRTAHWKRWGPYVSERQWGTVREDYSPDGAAWEYFPHDHARSRAYRWGEDGLAGISDNHQRLCFALALWNGRDPILKERLFGLTNREGNHGEDVKEYSFVLDGTPTHSYMKWLYKYPQAPFPYAALLEGSARRGARGAEYELIETGVFADDRYHDVIVEYAKATPDDILIRITVANRGPEDAELHLLPTLWFRNDWSWSEGAARPELSAVAAPGAVAIRADHATLGPRWLAAAGAPETVFTENETNAVRLFGVPNRTPWVKDGIERWLLHGEKDAVNAARRGTKAALHYRLLVPAGGERTIALRLADTPPAAGLFGRGFATTFAARIREADAFYGRIIPASRSEDGRRVMRQALAGLLWSKQFYHYDVKQWLAGDPAQPAPPGERRRGRNRNWAHLYNEDVLSVPDKWEYPWYAAWDLGFHAIPLALVDAGLAKSQLTLLLREWYMHPNGQLPAYEWAFDDVNPPVHAWAAWRVYKIDAKRSGTPDRTFLQHVFHKLLLNFTWWVNRKDVDGLNIFQGGFLGLDNIGVFDRSKPLPTGGVIQQSDATAWMGMYCLNMLAIALELARDDAAYENVASKFFEHFVYIAHAIDDRGGDAIGLWDEADGFYYDVLDLPDGRRERMRVRSMVGLIPLFAVETLEPEIVDRLPGFKRRMQWFIDNRPEFREHVETATAPDGGVRHLLSIVSRPELPRVLRYLLDEAEFLGPHGVRAVSKYHRDHPYVLACDGDAHRVDYEPGESANGLFGGNSNWRGPVWFPVNYLLIESLQKLDWFYGASLRVPCPTGSPREMTLGAVATELSRRLVRIFLRGPDGRRPVYGDVETFQTDPHWRDLVSFYEYFHGDTGRGLGASHQTGWTALVAKLLQQSGE